MSQSKCQSISCFLPLAIWILPSFHVIGQKFNHPKSSHYHLFPILALYELNQELIRFGKCQKHSIQLNIHLDFLYVFPFFTFNLKSHDKLILLFSMSPDEEKRFGRRIHSSGRGQYMNMVFKKSNIIKWFYGVMAITLDFESNNPSSSLGRTSLFQ